MRSVGRLLAMGICSVTFTLGSGVALAQQGGMGDSPSPAGAGDTPAPGGMGRKTGPGSPSGSGSTGSTGSTGMGNNNPGSMGNSGGTGTTGGDKGNTGSTGTTGSTGDRGSTGSMNQPSADEAAPSGAGARTLSRSDEDFLRKAAQGNLAEVKLSQLASDKSTNPDVKNIAQRMLDDHTKAGEQLRPIAEKKGFMLPRELTGDEAREYSRLAKLSGTEFDRAYLKALSKDHSDDIALYQKEVKSGQDPEVKSFAEQLMPTLRAHEKMVKGEMKTHTM